MPWPVLGFTYVNTEITKKGHPGTPVLYDPSKAVARAASPSGRDSASSATA